jgi:hypothetical protein
MKITTLFPQFYAEYLNNLTPPLLEQTVNNGMFYMLYSIRKNVKNSLENTLNEIPIDKRKLSNNLSIKDNEEIVAVINKGFELSETKNDTTINIFVDEGEYQKFVEELDNFNLENADPLNYLLSGLLQVAVMQQMRGKVFMPDEIVGFIEMSNKFANILHFITTKILLPLTIILKKLTDKLESKK